MSKFEELMQKLLNGETITEEDYPVMSRLEKILIACINKTGTEGLGIPQSRAEELLQLLSIKMTQTSEDSGDKDMLQQLIDYTKSCSCLFMSTSFTGVELDAFSALDTSNVTNMSSMFSDCYDLTTIPQLDTRNVTDMNYMFGYCYSLTTIPQLDTSNVTDMHGMFYGCEALTTIPQLDTSNVTDMSSMFSDCYDLTTIPQLDTSNVTDMSYTFYGCEALTTIPQLDTSNVTNTTSMFRGCKSLTTIPQLDASNVSVTYDMFGGCESLTTILMYGMQLPFDISSSECFTREDLVIILNNLATIKYSMTLTMGSTNLAKLTDEDKLIATNKGWTLK